MLMRWPRDPRVELGITSERLVANVDLAPTVMDAVGASLEAGEPPMDGISLLDAGRQRTRMLNEGWFQNGVPPWASIRTAPWSPEHFQYIGYSSGLREYYDLRSDPFQLHNLYGGDGQYGTADDLPGAPSPPRWPLSSCRTAPAPARPVPDPHPIRKPPPNRREPLRSSLAWAVFTRGRHAHEIGDFDKTAALAACALACAAGLAIAAPAAQARLAVVATGKARVAVVDLTRKQRGEQAARRPAHARRRAQLRRAAGLRGQRQGIARAAWA